MQGGKTIAHKFLAKPVMYKKLLSLQGRSVFIGCGNGEECECIKSFGFQRVVSIDISKGLIDFVKKSYPDLDF